jgi:septum formation protein
LIRLHDKHVILASSSPRRHELLQLIGIPHVVQPAGADESYKEGEKPAEHAERLAQTKVRSVAAANPEAIIIAADTIVVADGEIMGKPRDRGDAMRMLAILQGRSHTVITAVAVSCDGRTESDIEHVEVTFRPLDSDEIAAYIDTGEPMDKAGAYGIQGYGATIVRRIDGDYFAVMGLSLVLLVELLEKAGIRYWFAR